MKEQSRFLNKLTSVSSAVIFLLLVGGASLAFASLTFTGTNITGNGNAIIDAPGTISIGTSTATGITIGNGGINMIPMTMSSGVSSTGFLNGPAYLVGTSSPS